METRPALAPGLKAADFRDFYYLKTELVQFCKAQGLPASGGKRELTERIAHYLDTGAVLPAVRKSRSAPKAAGGITADGTIGPDFVCTEEHRAFFREAVGPSFSFNVPFQKWLRANPDKTYAQAVEAYRRLLAEKKAGKTVIDPPFEYNTYIRAFFADNPGKPLAAAILCWKHKKSLPGHNRYERADLAALEP